MMAASLYWHFVDHLDLPVPHGVRPRSWCPWRSLVCERCPSACQRGAPYILLTLFLDVGVQHLIPRLRG